MRQENVIDERQIGEREIGNAGSGVDQQIMIDQNRRRPQLRAADSAAAAENRNLHAGPTASIVFLPSARWREHPQTGGQTEQTTSDLEKEFHLDAGNLDHIVIFEPPRLRIDRLAVEQWICCSFDVRQEVAITNGYPAAKTSTAPKSHSFPDNPGVSWPEDEAGTLLYPHSVETGYGPFVSDATSASATCCGATTIASWPASTDSNAKPAATAFSYIGASGSAPNTWIRPSRRAQRTYTRGSPGDACTVDFCDAKTDECQHVGRQPLDHRVLLAQQHHDGRMATHRFAHVVDSEITVES